MITPRTIGAGCAFALAVATAGTASAAEKDWPTYSGNDARWQYSTLARINRDDVKNLSFAWARSLGNAHSQESNPIVVGDTLYVTSANGVAHVMALDAATGALRWKVELEMPAGVQQYACCGVVNRGVAYSDGTIYVGRLDGALSAFDAETGEEKWTVEVVDDKQGSVITSPPLVVGDLVITDPSAAGLVAVPTSPTEPLPAVDPASARPDPEFHRLS